MAVTSEALALGAVIELVILIYEVTLNLEPVTHLESSGTPTSY